MINGNILGKRFRSRSSSNNPRISPLTLEYECPQLSLLTMSSSRPHQQKAATGVPFCHSMLNHTVGRSAPAWNTLICSQEHVRAEGTKKPPSGGLGPGNLSFKGEKPDRGPGGTPQGRERPNPSAHCCTKRGRRRNGGALGNLTTSFLSAAKLIYAIGAGVTAAAGRHYFNFSTKLTLHS